MKVVEIFKSIQGEGFNFGKEVVFLRLGKCNLKCPWCDTDWNKYKKIELENIIYEIEKENCKSVIITGGEPTMQDLKPLCKKLKEKGFWIGIETNGTNDVGYEFIDYIATSPKFFYKDLVKLNLKKANEIRIVVDNDDVEEYVKFCKKIENEIEADRFFLSPVEESETANFLNLETLAKVRQQLNEREEKEWQVSIQLHKLMKVK
ncbi:7-carboxy-7-deazaguanine synthase QueE [Leptotrichia sp. oral taxon 223]|uniref:7-carboxy-7-deazaguanine synthase QueE n=1 Tax=Leptotrichia sp. oral taxon 223 TaxID=712363 RepID=UPI0015BDE4B6|nr:7-carboxy-7-deazaguanine synthase QueE [Leptotrichia sp. oral taxon 223]NWO18848.1 7-carboxy-7-deazaguanine synthase QueE [Leptotrichia sp. oral taxon 223]